MTRFELIPTWLSPFVSFAAPVMNPSPRDPVLLELFTSTGVRAVRLMTPFSANLP
jgi:hypothetical protein